ncbi:SLATT domain-containing protein [Amycolatopsis thermoflava]|uniref:SLATT domain-containing protein n=1 Tax=Amycolatopsis thermoflava TaxID=84480 RepID=UPI003D72CBDA
MALSKEEVGIYVSQMSHLYEDASYSAQAYFEAAKLAEFWGRAIVFLPSLVGAIGGILVALDEPKQWGALSAVAGAVAATASFLGASRNAASYKDSARQFTTLRHKASLEIALAGRKDSEKDLENATRALREEYDAIVSSSEPTPGRAFRKAQNRIRDGVLEYDGESPDRNEVPKSDSSH